MQLRLISEQIIAAGRPKHLPSIEEQPLIAAVEGEDWICDPRITRMGDIYYILYRTGDKFGVRTVLVTTKDFRSINKQGHICEPDNRNMALFSEKINGLYARLDRPYGLTNNGSIWISYSPDLVYWGDFKTDFEPRKNFSMGWFESEPQRDTGEDGQRLLVCLSRCA